MRKTYSKIKNLPVGCIVWFKDEKHMITSSRSGVPDWATSVIVLSGVKRGVLGYIDREMNVRVETRS